MANDFDFESLIALDPEAEDFQNAVVLRTGTFEEKNAKARELAAIAGVDMSPGFSVRVGSVGDKPTVEVARGGKVVWSADQLFKRHGERVGQQLAGEAESQPSALNPLERLGRSIKISPEGKRRFTEEVTGKEVFQTPRGEVVAGPEEGGQFVDKPMSVAQAGLAMSAFLGPLAPVAAPVLAAGLELFEPGVTKEFASDIADLGGVALEVLPDAAAAYFLRRSGAVTPLQLGAQVGAGGAGPLIRRTVSEALPGEDIGLRETLQLAGTSGALSGIADAATRTARAVPTAARGAVVTRLLGDVSQAEIAATEKIARKMGLQFDPAMLSLDDDALLLTTMLRRTPGAAKLWKDKDMRNIVQASRFMGKWADSTLGLAKRTPEAVAERLATGSVRYDKLLHSKATGKMGLAMKAANDAFGGKAVLKYDNLLEKIAEYEGKGYNMSGVRAGLSKFKVGSAPAPAPAAGSGAFEPSPSALRLEAKVKPPQVQRMTVDQMQTRLADYAQGDIPLLATEADRASHVKGQLKKALERDLDAAIANPALAEGAASLRQGRAFYRSISRVQQNSKTKLLKKALGLKADQNLEFLPKDILAGKFSTRQLKIFGGVADKVDPGSRKALTRSVWDEALAETGADAVTVRGAQIERAGQAADVTARSPLNTAKALKKAQSKIEALHGEKLSDLDDIINGFQQLNLIDQQLAKSPTAGLLSGQQFMKAAANALVNPSAAFRELGALKFRQRISAILTDPNGRDVLATLLNPTPSATAHSVSVGLQKLGTIVARERAFSETVEEDSDENK